MHHSVVFVVLFKLPATRKGLPFPPFVGVSNRRRRFFPITRAGVIGRKDGIPRTGVTNFTLPQKKHI